MTKPIKSLHQAYREIIEAADTSKSGSSLKYAAGYAKHGLRLDDALVIDGVKQPLLVGTPTYVQALYVRNNLSGWRGDRAKEIRKFIDALTK